MQKIVTIGGGTGHYQILRGLKNYDCDLTAIVNMSDDGGSTGILRDEYGVLPPGDVRQCLIALANDEETEDLKFIFNYRFNSESKHNLGNLILTALEDKYGNVNAIKKVGKLLRIRGNVLPVTVDNVTLCAETFKGNIIRGESRVSYPEDKTVRIKRLFYEPEAFVYHESAEAIRHADKIIICAGHLYGSILPNSAVTGMQETLQESKNSKKIYVCNLFTSEGTFGFKASDFIQEIEKSFGINLDYILINNRVPSRETRIKYLSEQCEFLEDNLPSNDHRIIRGDFVGEFPQERKTLFRHVPEKIGRAIMCL